MPGKQRSTGRLEEYCRSCRPITCHHSRSLLSELASGKVPAEAMSFDVDELLALSRAKLAKVLSCSDSGPVSYEQCATDTLRALRRHFIRYDGKHLWKCKLSTQGSAQWDSVMGRAVFASRPQRNDMFDGMAVLIREHRSVGWQQQFSSGGSSTSSCHRRHCSEDEKSSALVDTSR